MKPSLHQGNKEFERLSGFWHLVPDQPVRSRMVVSLPLFLKP